MSVLSREGHRLRHSPGSDLGCGGLYKAFGDYQITATEFLVLIVVADKPGVSQADLAQAPDVERSRFVPTVNKLEKRGLAKRTVFAGDGRVGLIQPMKRGHQLVRVLKKKKSTNIRKRRWPGLIQPKRERSYPAFGSWPDDSHFLSRTAS